MIELYAPGWFNETSLSSWWRPGKYPVVDEIALVIIMYSAIYSSLIEIMFTIFYLRKCDLRI